MKPGIYRDFDPALYYDDPCDAPSLNSTVAKLLVSETPLHAWTAHPRLNPDYRRDEDARFDIGTAAHELLLGGDTRVRVIEFENYYSNAAKEAREAARADGKLPLLSQQWDHVQGMIVAARELFRSPSDPPLFDRGSAETVIVWEDEGVTCRARLDWLRDDFASIDDYKTTSGSADPERWGSQIFKRGHDVQVAFYLRGIQALTGETPDFRFVVQETSPPYALSVVTLGADAYTIAQKKVTRAITLWRRCLRSGDWPGYGIEPFAVELPPWEEARWLARELEDEAA